MGKFKTACPNCHTELEVCGEWSGCQAYCPTCNSLITIPFPSEEPEEGRMVVCPECGLAQKIPPDGAKHLYNCRSCGAPFAASASIIFRIAKKLVPDEPGMLKIACPYCGWHYILGYEPKDGLVGCPKCLNIFVSPDAEWLNKDAAAPATIPPATTATPAASEAPATPAEELLLMPSMKLPPPPPPPAPSSNKFTLPSQLDTLHLTLPADQIPPAAAPEAAESKSKVAIWLKSIFGEEGGRIALNILRVIGNIVWMILGGIFASVTLFLNGCLLCLTIIGIPFGLQMFKLAGLSLAPFGSDVYRKQQSEKVGCWSTGFNVLWLLMGGLWVSLAYFLTSLIFFISIIGIPIALQYVKFGKLMLTPFGLEVRQSRGMFFAYVVIAVLLIATVIILL